MLVLFVSLPELGGATGNDVWGWTDPQTGREYALVRTSTSTGDGNHAFIVSEITDSGPQVFDLTRLRGAPPGTTPDHRSFLFGDELDEQEHGQSTTTYIMNAADLDAPGTPVAFLHETRSIDRNLSVHGNRVYESNYMAGLRILEYDKKSLQAGRLREIAYFDVVPALDEPEFAGTWSNYRFPGSGITVVSVIENELSGLFVLKPQLADGGKKGGGGGRR